VLTDGGRDEEHRARSALRAWAGPILGQGEISFARRESPPVGDRGVSFRLQALEAGAVGPVEPVEPVGPVAAAHYSVSAWAQEPDEASRLLARLVVAAFDHPHLEVDLGLPPKNTWTGLEPRPRPRCQVRVLIGRSRRW
jgi:hypothetical protein